jgi:hypothetical protein
MSEEADADAAADPAENDSDDPAAFEARLDEVAAAIEGAATESELDEAEATIDEVAADIEAAFPDADEEDEDSPRADLDERVSAVRDSLDDARGPYATDATESIETARDEIADTRWTEAGAQDLGLAIGTLSNAVTSAGVDHEATVPAQDVIAPEALDGVTEVADALVDAIEGADLDPDDDAEAVEALVAAADEFAEAVDAAEAWDDLSLREQLDAEGFYDVLEHRRDFPPEWDALKSWEDAGRVDMICLAYDRLGSEYMERHCLEALNRLGDPACLDTVAPLAERREVPAVEILGSIGPAATDHVDTLVEFIDPEGDIELQRAVLRALGEIGDASATDPVAQVLAAEDEELRSAAARSLGLLGDPRAIDPLAAVLADDSVDEVRASAAWALRQIGTERAQEALVDRDGDPSPLVAAETRRVA